LARNWPSLLTQSGTLSGGPGRAVKEVERGGHGQVARGSTDIELSVAAAWGLG
jgi:hypothetical protein